MENIEVKLNQELLHNNNNKLSTQNKNHLKIYNLFLLTE